MIRKKILIALVVLLPATAVSARQQPLTGSWRYQINRVVPDLLFLEPGKAAFTSRTGLLGDYVYYTAKQVRNNVISFRFTINKDRKRPKYLNGEMQFINDSTMLFKPQGKLPKDANVTTRRLYVLKKVPEKSSGTGIRLPGYSDLVGKWASYFKGKARDLYFSFNPDGSSVLREGDKTFKMKYTIDFTKLPIPLELTSVETSKTVQAFIRFQGDSLVRIQFFPKNNRGDHFTTFGRNALFIKQ